MVVVLCNRSAAGECFDTVTGRTKLTRDQVPNGGLTTFNTLIISGLGFGPLETSLLAMPPGAMSTLSGIALSFLAATTRKYRVVMIVTAVLLPLLGAVLCYSLERTNLAGQLIGL